MANPAAIADFVSSTPARRATRYIVTLTTGESFTVLVHRGSVPAERIGAMVAHHETIRSVTVEDGI